MAAEVQRRMPVRLDPTAISLTLLVVADLLQLNYHCCTELLLKWGKCITSLYLIMHKAHYTLVC
jgi:hypothetical protein